MFKKEREVKAVVMFTDMKDFTVKSSLMTDSQLTKILEVQEKIIFDSISAYNGKVIKSMGDGYMIFFDEIEKSVDAALEIKSKLYEHNKREKLPLFKIEVRIGMDYGDIVEKKTVFGKDIFGITVNIASRLESINKSNDIYITSNIVDGLNNIDNYNIISIGKKNLKGIIDNIEVFVLLENGVDKDNYLKSIKNFDFDLESKQQEKINNVIFKISAIGALISTQPLPLLDIYNLLALQLYLLKEISEIYGLKITDEESKKILFQVISIIGVNYAIGQGVIGISKVGLPVVGGYLVIPITFGMTYASGKVLNVYLYYKLKNSILKDEDIKQLFTDNIKKGKQIGKKEKDNIIEIGKKNKNIFINKIKEIYKKYDLSNFYKNLKEKVNI